ncbi:hypothetical protein GGD62_005320 [Bradyrhizobium sp. ERR14]|nr:hypothetical protein [Bradyrhizobium sp. ERR14]
MPNCEAARESDLDRLEAIVAQFVRVFDIRPISET